MALRPRRAALFLSVQAQPACQLGISFLLDKLTFPWGSAHTEAADQIYWVALAKDLDATIMDMVTVGVSTIGTLVVIIGALHTTPSMVWYLMNGAIAALDPFKRWH